MFLFSYRAEGSSKIQSRLEQQTSRLSQQMKTGSGTKAPFSTKSSPPKEKMSPSSPMDDIERGNMSCFTSQNCVGLSRDIKSI